MRVDRKHYKHSNSGEIITVESFHDVPIDVPDNYFNLDGKQIKYTPDLTGYVKITSKTYNLAKKKVKKVSKLTLSSIKSCSWKKSKFYIKDSDAFEWMTDCGWNYDWDFIDKVDTCPNCGSMIVIDNSK